MAYPPRDYRTGYTANRVRRATQPVNGRFGVGGYLRACWWVLCWIKRTYAESDAAPFWYEALLYVVIMALIVLVGLKP